MPWQKVDVGLADPSESTTNHYDHKINARDLPARPGEQVGIFNGLEVISGDSYRFETKEGVSTFRVIDTPPPSTNNVASASGSDTRKSKPSEEPSTNKSKKSKKRKRKNKSNAEADVEKKEEISDDDKQKVASLQSSWSESTGGVMLNLQICEKLLREAFWTPTPIQAATLPAAILGRCNILGAAPTGSGKTLSYLLPIVQHLAVCPEDELRSLPLQALILTPTRELALQVQEVGKLFTRIGCIIGGLAQVKQARVLDKNRPPVLVGTVGRLWELMSSREHSHLNDLSRLRFLVMDEADRMIQQGSYQELINILEGVHRANPMDDDSDDEEESDESEDEDEDGRLLSLPGVRGEAKVSMLTDDILSQLAKQRGEEPVVREIDNDEYEAEDAESDEDEIDEEALPLPPPVNRQTFIYSATLTLAKPEKAKKRKRSEPATIDGPLSQLLTISHAKGKTKVVDLSSFKKSSTKSFDKEQEASDKEKKRNDRFQLPPGLKFQQLSCTQLHKDSHLYAYFMTASEGSKGHCLVFCNSIAGVRRVSATLKQLRIDARTLHANMQQRARLKVLEALRSGKGRVVVVATDVAARGLDIPSVALVVHYDAARNVDTFVHRSGRTARGMGPNAVGCSLSLVAAADDKTYSRIGKKLSVRFEPVNIDGRLMSGAQQRVNLATKIVVADELNSKTRKSNAWFREKAAELDIEIDEDEVMEQITDTKDISRLREGMKAKERLRNLLSQPLQTQRYGKFLSTNSAVVGKKVAGL